MAYDTELADRVRIRFTKLQPTEEKNMMGGLAFMLDDKLCVAVMKRGLLCRVDPAIRQELLHKEGCSIMEMNHREMPGFVNVDADVLANDPDLDYWIGLCVQFNPRAASSKK